MPQTADGEQNKETKTNAYESVEDRLKTDSINDVNEQAESKQEGYGLQPDKRAARTIGTRGLGLIDELLQLAKILWPLFT